MKKQLLSALLLFFSLNLFASSDAILSIDTGGHTDMIKDVIITKSGDIITASDDKTIRVWDSKSGIEKRKILGQIGVGLEGQIFAIALSNDERFLAVGGYFANNEIRLYDYQRGKLLTILKSHTNVVNDLAFNGNGRYLLSGSSDKTIKLWDLSSLRTDTVASAKGGTEVPIPLTIHFHTNFVYGMKFIKRGDEEIIISTGDDNKIALHDFSGKLLNSYTHNKKLRYIATKDNEIATYGFGNEILIFNERLNLKNKIKSETVPTGLAYSKDGKYLIAGAGTSPRNVNIYDSTKNYAKITSFTKHTNLTEAVAFLDNTTAVSAGGDNNEIYIWDIHSKKIHTEIASDGKKIWSVGVDGDQIAWGNVLDIREKNNAGSLQKSFDLKTHTTQTISHTKSSFHRIDSSGLSHSQGG